MTRLSSGFGARRSVYCTPKLKAVAENCDVTCSPHETAGGHTNGWHTCLRVFCFSRKFHAAYDTSTVTVACSGCVRYDTAMSNLRLANICKAHTTEVAIKLHRRCVPVSCWEETDGGRRGSGAFLGLTAIYARQHVGHQTAACLLTTQCAVLSFPVRARQPARKETRTKTLWRGTLPAHDRQEASRALGNCWK
jgi:hypothetical protein